MSQTTHIPLVNLGDGNAHCGNIIGSFNSTVYESDEDVQIMSWLSTLEPSVKHQGIRNDGFDGVGGWILETNEFRECRGGGSGADSAVLFCSGNPGVGKTYLSSLVIDTLCDQARNEDITVVGLYYDYLAQQDQTVANMMGAILKQIVSRRGIPEHLREAFRKGKMEVGGRRLRLPDLIEMLRTAVASLSEVFICIDALDECRPKQLPELLGSLRDIVRDCPKTRLFLTGRPHIKEDIQKRYFTKAVVIPISTDADDIRNYLDMRLDRDTDPEAMDDDLRADIVRIIMERVSDIFLLVSLNIEAILGGVTIRRRRKKLEDMTIGNGLSGAYTETLMRLRGQNKDKSMLGLKVLMWVLHSQRPLRTEELRHALGVETGSLDLDPENVPAIRTLLASCLGLVIVEPYSSNLRLVHITLKEHLSSDQTLFHSLSSDLALFHGPHTVIAETCLTYLNFECVRDISPAPRWARSMTPFLEYASYYWGNHARRGMTENVKVLALRLLDRFDEHISSQLILDHNPSLFSSGEPAPTGLTGLHVAASIGIAEIFAAVLKGKEWDVNLLDCTGLTALAGAAGAGHEEAVKMLLEREGLNPDHAGTRHSLTPLLIAARKGHEGMYLN